MIANLRIGIRLSVIVVILLAALAGVSWYALHEIRDRLMAERQNQSRIMVQGALSQFARFHALELSGKMTRDEAQRQALNATDTLRYGADQYVWVNDSRPVVLSHPVPALVGRDVSGVTDADGRPLFKEFVRISAESGHGTLTYRWPRLDDDVPRLKISYVESFKPWNWTVGSGVYVDDVDNAYREAAGRFGLFAVFTGMVGALLAWLTGLSIIRPLSQITRQMTRLAAGQDVPLRETRRTDEIGELMQAMAAFRHHLSERDHYRDARDAVLREAGTVFNLITDAVMVTDARNHIKLVNPAFTRVTGYGPDEVIGRMPSILSSGRHDPAFYAAMWSHLAESGCWAGEIWNRAKNGEVYPEWLSITAIRDREGRAQGYVATFRNISERKHQESRMRWQAEHDALTGLANRVHFEASLALSMADAREGEGDLALLYIDLDGFKAINDIHGHAVGDTVLSQIGWRFQEVLRADDLVARLGGDEFAVVIRTLHRKADAMTIAEKIVGRLAEPFTLNGITVRIAASVGIAVYPEHGLSPRDLIVAADHAMYRRKSVGGNGATLALAGEAAEIEVQPAI